MSWVSPLPSWLTTYRSPLPLRVLVNTTRPPSGESAGSKSLAGLFDRSRTPLPSDPVMSTSAFPDAHDVKTSGTTASGCWPGASGVVNVASSAASLPHAVIPTSR